MRRRPLGVGGLITKPQPGVHFFANLEAEEVNGDLLRPRVEGQLGDLRELVVPAAAVGALATRAVAKLRCAAAKMGKGDRESGGGSQQQ